MPTKSEALRSHLELAIERGAHPGHVPIGYKPSYRPPYVPEIDETAALIPVTTFNLAAKGHSLGAIAQALTRAGFTARRKGVLTRQAVHAILRNPFYMGVIRFKGELHPGKHEPLISKDLFTEAQRQLSRRGEPAGVVPVKLA